MSGRVPGTRRRAWARDLPRDPLHGPPLLSSSRAALTRVPRPPEAVPWEGLGCGSPQHGRRKRQVLRVGAPSPSFLPGGLYLASCPSHRSPDVLAALKGSQVTSSFPGPLPLPKATFPACRLRSGAHAVPPARAEQKLLGTQSGLQEVPAACTPRSEISVPSGLPGAQRSGQFGQYSVQKVLGTLRTPARPHPLPGLLLLSRGSE